MKQADMIGNMAVDRGVRDRWWSTWLLGGIASLVWVIRYQLTFGLHLLRPPLWVDWFDQSRYVLSAKAFAIGDLSPGQHWYPLAYSLTAAPFARLLPNEPFFIPDLLLFGLTAVGFQRAMRVFGIGAFMSLFLFLVGDLAVRKVARLWLEPWTTTLSAALLWWLIALLLETALRAPVEAKEAAPPPSSRFMLGIGLLAGALPAIRPTDLMTAVLALGFAGLMLHRQGRLTVRGSLWTTFGAAIVVLSYLALHLAIYGLQPTEYMRASADQGFAFGDLPWKFSVVLIAARPWFPDSPSLIEGMPWIVPGIAGLIVAVCTMERRARTGLALIALVAIPYCLLFLAYTDLQPPGIWGFGNAHYFKWLIPLAALGCWLWLKALTSRRGATIAIGALALVLLPCCIRPLPVPVGEDQPARMLLFRGSTKRLWSEAYFAPASITDSRGTMFNIRRFHQIPDANGERALAVFRLFGRTPRRTDLGEPPPFRLSQAPYGRFGVRLSLGLPCWFATAACRALLPG